MKTTTTHKFSEVPKADIPRSSFDRSHGFKAAFYSGWLYPIFVDEALPGDTFNLQLTAFSRFATPIFPIMDNMFMDTFFFFTPNRLVWDNWEKFNGAQTDPGDSTDFLIPQVPAPVGGFVPGNYADLCGVPPGIDDISVNSLHFRAMNLIWNEWFRDQNLQDSLTVPMGDGPDSNSDFGIQKRGKRHDYFTSCLPWPQKGDSVDLPLGTRANVVYDGASAGAFNMGTYSVADAAYHAMDGTVGQVVSDATGAINASGELYADLTTATAATINQLRQAFQTQKLLERDARGGTRISLFKTACSPIWLNAGQ